MATVKNSNIFNISEKRTEVKIKKKIEVLLGEYVDAYNEDDAHRSCVVETIDGAFHKTNLNDFDSRGIFCTKGSGHCEFFNYNIVKNIF